MISIRQEGHDYNDNKWIIEVKEKWYVFDQKEEDELTRFLRQHRIPYGIDYTFEGIIFILNIQKIESTRFELMKELVNTLLDYKNKFVNPTPTPL